MRSVWLGLVVLFVIACGPGPAERDSGGGVDATTPEVDVGVDAPRIDAPASDAGDPCTSEEGYYECFGQPRQCCGGQWHYFFDGPCFFRDGGGFDAGPTDCTATPLTPGCPCTDDGVSECRFLQSSLRCEAGIWTERSRIACCSF